MKEFKWKGGWTDPIRWIEYLKGAIDVYDHEGVKMIKRIRELENKIKELEQKDSSLFLIGGQG
jgi:hypothetical protein